MQQSALYVAGRSSGARCDLRAPSKFIPPLLLTAAVAALLSACSSTDAVTTSAAAALGSEASTNPELPGDDLRSSPSPSNVVMTPSQHDYLDALTAAGVHPSTALEALSIGSYVCQAQAAGQSDQAVRDFVRPLVRGDVKEQADDSVADANGKAPSIDTVAADYIRIATDRLC